MGICGLCYFDMNSSLCEMGICEFPILGVLFAYV